LHFKGLLESVLSDLLEDVSEALLKVLVKDQVLKLIKREIA